MPHEKLSSSEPDSRYDAVYRELDEVEARAAALREQIAARRINGADDDTSEPVARSAPRRLAPPPWQLHTAIGSRGFRERFESGAAGVGPSHSEGPSTRAEQRWEHPSASESHPLDEGNEPASGGADTPPPAPRVDLPEVAGSPPPQRDWQLQPQPSQSSPPPWSQAPPLPLPPPPPGWLPPLSEPPATRFGPPQGFRLPPSLDEAEVVHRNADAPQSGWRRAVHRASAGRVNPGESRKAREKDDLHARISGAIVGDFRIAVLSIKGGVGKTTTTLGLGSALAMVRTDRVVAVDANPDRGTLAERVRDTTTTSTVRDLLSDPDITRYADVRDHTRMAGSRLEVLASEEDPAVAEVFGEADYRRTVDILRHYYNIILTDCGTGIMHSAMAGVLDLAHTIVLVSSPAIDAARSASATLDWLTQHGHSALVREAHVVLSASRPGSAALKLDKVFEHFQARCRSTHLIPFDPHLAEGADVDFSLLKPATCDAYLELAGAVAEKFPRLRGGRHRQ